MYLTQNHFNRAIGIAVLFHLILLGVYAMHYQADPAKVLQKPIYVKLGKAPKASEGEQQAKRERKKTSPSPVIKSTVAQPKEPIPTPEEKKPSPIDPIEAQVVQAFEKIKTLIPDPTKILKQKEAPKIDKTIPKPLSKPRVPKSMVKHYNKPVTKQIAPTTTAHQELPFVQELKSQKNEVKGISGHELGNRTKAEQLVITSYEQKLALWLQKHHSYPMAARQADLEGEAVVRMQIDRLGNIRFYELAENTQHAVLDNAVIKMVERSDPVPPVPDDYPGDYVLEFLIPVNFKLR